MVKRTRQIVLSRAAGMLALALVFGMSGAGRAQAADALIISAPGYAYPATITNLTTLLTAASYTVTSVTAVPPSLSTYTQVWDVRIDTAILPAEATIFTTYLAGGGSLFLLGENAGFAARNNSIISLVSALGGGTLGPVTTSFTSQTIRAPFTGPNAVATIAWQASGRMPTAGTGSFIATEPSGGSSLVFDPGTMAAAPGGALILAFDINFLLGPVTPNETDLAKNIIAYLASPVAVTPPVVPPSAPAPAPAPPGGLTPYPPTITSIANQLVPVSTTRTLNFTVGGAVIFDALTVRVSTSNIAFTPTLSLNRLDHEGHWTVTVVGADGRSGSAVITLTVNDTSRDTSTSFTFATSPTLPGRPSNLVAAPSGSGVALTWSEPNTGAPGRYVIAASTTPGGSNVSVFVTPDASTNYVIATIPPGTYYFRVWGVGDALGPASNEATVVAAGSTTVAGVPSGLVSTVDGSNVTVSWNPPGPQGPSQYLVEFGTAAGSSDVAIVTAVSATHTRAVAPGLSFVRVRSFNGGAPSAPSNETSIPVGLGGCLAAPFAPVLLPAAKNGGIVTLSWLAPLSWAPDGATAADSYRVELIPVSGSVATTTVGAGTSSSWSGLAGAYRARVTGLNRCGTGAVSNEVGFSQP